MQLSLYTDYALRVLLFLGANQERRVSMQEISDCYGISREHLRKVVHMLAQHEIIETYRGKNGGFVLRKTPAEINIGNLVEITEKRKPLIDCDEQPCIITASCTLKGVLGKAERAFYNTLKEYTLKDLLKSRSMETLLRVSAG
ncbi:MAG: Rrf2 family transcriptional regulator [Pseudomonadales bacterium]|jgi:Rrf2 family transcriptional regulator, nitric oxide-sensitive transcriptional repressor|uniref:RrF2 family transcriptional regulator n=1 Tax=unclassified Ketobacter TaxID=2639109 RepID=UPI000C5E1073|nr:MULTISPECIES: Rrf2 family transcriptional regulator [unclassified Ketobacter]MAQ23803.1 Rrf2 family transcriptional regulator [Pseudomonadales bacterium]MEC8813699.1 Rrf2 family transcriptional regulator [Pseudomonadota bacterium]HAG94520.1 Rrf2 family transcriptional regulator [Gammaproteobacteria bacterium]MBI26212.1 Rrf2 family transcriptional regulator [Pseudomonadales bacterium]MCK5792032.1 Rrf2 family transcriptional regulator [Ketobacter sp.]|tara:strand:- start:60779 stop:61207 length:429 start_codon:yes stop_codon:yes gene_type:complete